jgi:hypothetical protein
MDTMTSNRTETPTPATAGEAGEPQIIESLLDLEPATDQDMIDMGRCPNCGYPVRDHFRRATPAAPSLDDVRMLRDPVEVVAESLSRHAKSGSRQWFDLLARSALTDLGREGYELVSASEKAALESIATADPAPGEGE